MNFKMEILLFKGHYINFANWHMIIPMYSQKFIKGEVAVVAYD